MIFSKSLVLKRGIVSSFLLLISNSQRLKCLLVWPWDCLDTAIYTCVAWFDFIPPWMEQRLRIAAAVFGQSLAFFWECASCCSKTTIFYLIIINVYKWIMYSCSTHNSSTFPVLHTDYFQVATVTCVTSARFGHWKGWLNTTCQGVELVPSHSVFVRRWRRMELMKLGRFGPEMERHRTCDHAFHQSQT